jgi:uncharacterized protein (TIGR02118 family)
MVKTITFIKRKPGMSVDDFGQYWRKQHAAIVTRLPGLRRYVQCHTIPSGYRNGEPAYDGVAEVWFDSTDAMRDGAQTAEYRAVRADEPNFIDLAKIDFVITEERVQKDAPTDPSMMHLVGVRYAQARDVSRDIPAPLEQRARTARREDPDGPPLRAMPRTAGRVSRRPPAALRRRGRGLVRFHRRDARVGDHAGVPRGARR